MAETLLFSVAQGVLSKLGSLVLQEVRLAWGVKSDLEKLKDTLSSIQAVLLDAEDQQAVKLNHQLTDWLGKLKNIVYHIDDLLDEFEIAALQRQVKRLPGASIQSKVSNFFSSSSNPISFRTKMGHRIREVRKRLDAVVADRDKFKLTEAERPVDRPLMCRVRDTYSFVDDSNVIGRDQDKENIVVQLLKGLSSDDNLSIISIVGFGGLGKTTLAKMVYKDCRVTEQFNPRMWVCVSDEFDLELLMRKITESATDENCGNLGMERLQNRLRDALDAKKYLLVLDDVWNDDRVKWIKLRELLMAGAKGSKIIVTTRREKVAAIMGCNAPYHLEGLPHTQSMALFSKWAFEEGREKHRPDLVKIGEEIVQKCKGLPLAIRTLGSLLYNKTNERDWLFVRDNEIWKLEQKEDDILPTLKLSYDQLPSYLKQCFHYCSLFPKDYLFDSDELVSSWMAQGFIQSSAQNQELEDIGMKYIEELWSRSFFQEVVEYGTHLIFKMHDLVHDLALLVARTECTIVNSHTQGTSIPKTLRHVSFSTWDWSGEEIPSALLDELQNARTIYFQLESASSISKSFVEKYIPRYKCLRMLHLQNSSFKALPTSIGSLKHLRYLDLSNNPELQSLPDSLCNLLSLQTLLLGHCMELQKLPRDIGKLINLRRLQITTQESSLVDKGIGSLTSLRYLSFVGCNNLTSLLADYEMKNLSAIRTLVIGGCGNLMSVSTKGLRYLNALENLMIFYCDKLDLMMMDDTQGGEGLRSLRFLGIDGMSKMVTLPPWLLQGGGSAAANTVKHIHITDCPNLTTLMIEPLLEDLKALQKLWIARCPLLTSLPDRMHLLTSLEEICIEGCDELARRCQRETGEDWHKIAHVLDIYLDRFMV